MGILLQGKAVQKSDTTALNRVNSGNNSSKGKGDNEAPPPLLSSNSIHSMTSTERNSTKSPSRKMAPLSARGR